MKRARQASLYPIKRLQLPALLPCVAPPDLVKQGIDHAQLNAPVIAAVRAVPGFLEPVKALKADAQALA